VVPDLPGPALVSTLRITSLHSAAETRRGHTARWPAYLGGARLGGRLIGIYVRIGDRAAVIAVYPKRRP